MLLSDTVGFISELPVQVTRITPIVCQIALMLFFLIHLKFVKLHASVYTCGILEITYIDIILLLHFFLGMTI